MPTIDSFGNHHDAADGRFAEKPRAAASGDLDARPTAPQSLADAHLRWLRANALEDRKAAAADGLQEAVSLRRTADLIGMLRAADSDAAALTFLVDRSEDQPYYFISLEDTHGSELRELARDEFDVVNAMLPDPRDDDDAAYDALGVASSEETDWMERGRLVLSAEREAELRLAADVAEGAAVDRLLGASAHARMVAAEHAERAATAPIGAAHRHRKAAAEHLESSGLRVVDSDWRSRYGEMPIVARDGVTWVFVTDEERPLTREGLRRMRTLATLWMQAHDVRGPMRVDQVVTTDEGQHVTHTKGLR